MIKYFVKTHNFLPCSKWLWDDLEDLGTLIDRMLRKKPKEVFFDVTQDLEISLEVVKIDTELCPQWQQIFKTNTEWRWKDVITEPETD